MEDKQNSLRREDVQLSDSASNPDWVAKLPDNMRSAYEQIEKDLSGLDLFVSGCQRPDEGWEDLLKFYKKRCPQYCE